MTTSKITDSAAKKSVTLLQRAIVDGLEDVKAQDIQVFNTEHLSPLFERVIVASGTSNRQTKALASSVKDAVKKAGFDKPRTEGEENGEWIIVDCGPVVAHIMQPLIRQYYRLEEMWGDMPVRMKLGAPKPKRAAESEDDGAKKKPARKRAAATDAVAEPSKPAAKKSAAKKPAVSAAKPAAKAGAKPAARKPAAAKTAGKAPVKSAAKKPAAIKTVVVNKPSAAKKAAAKPAIKSAGKPAAAKPAAKTAAKPAAKRASASKAK